MHPNPDATYTCPRCGSDGAFVDEDDLPGEFADPFAGAAELFFEELREKEQIRHHGGGNRRRSGRFTGRKRVTWRRPVLTAWDEEEQPRRARRRRQAA